MSALSRFTLASTITLAVVVLFSGGARCAESIRVEAEDFLPPDGNATMGSGPNASSVVLVDVNPKLSGGRFIAFYVSWDWLEYTVTVPADGVYNLTFHYADGWEPIDPCPLVLSFYTTGKQYFVGNVHPTADWFTYIDTILAPADSSPALSIPLKAGENRFRTAIRPDYIFGGGLNWDYMDFKKAPDPYPVVTAVSGHVTSNIGGVETPLTGALVSEGADYHVAANMTRTDATGAYTLYLPAGSHSLTVFANGFQSVTTTVSAPGTLDFNMALNGRYEAEVLDCTNSGGTIPDENKGVQPAYDSGAISGNTLSNHGEIVNSGPGKYAEFRNVYAPADGVYDLGMRYSCWSQALGDPGYVTWAVNGGSTVKMSYAATSNVDFLHYADAAPVTVALKKGINTVRMTDANAGWDGNPPTPSANVDYFTINPSTRPHGILSVTVTKSESADSPVPGAIISVPFSSPQFTGVTGSDGTVSMLVPPGTYTVTANKSGASPVTASPVTVADGQTVSVSISLTSSGAAVEAEDYAAGGPAAPPVPVADVASASNGKVVAGFTGAYLQDWLEWDVVVTSDGLYSMTMQYAVPPDGDPVHQVYPIDMTVNVNPSTFHAHTTNIPRTANGDTYASYDLQDDAATPILVPLKTGSNRVRFSLAAGTMNLDYIQFTKLQAYPTLRTITGQISGSDGTGTAGIAGAIVWANNSSLHTSLSEAQFATTTDATGHFTLNARTGGAFLNASANGFLGSTPYVVVGSATTTKNLTLNVNPPTYPATGTQKIEAELVSIASPNISTNEMVITYATPGSYFEVPFSVARTGLYQVGMNYSSGWFPNDGNPVRTTWTVNGVPQEVDFAKTTQWQDYWFAPNIATISLVAGGNTLRVRFNEASANTDYFTLSYVGTLPPSRLAFSSQPSGAQSGMPFTSQPVVRVLDAYGNVVTSYTGPVTVAIKPGSGTAGALLSGVKTSNAVAGVATFTDLSINVPGTGFVLTANTGAVTPAESQPFDVAQVPTKLAFSVQPAGAQAGLPFTGQPVVQVLDAVNAVVTAYTGPVSIAIEPGTGTSGAALAGLTTVNAVAGVATFTGLSIDLAGTGYLMKAASGSLAPAETQPFDVTAILRVSANAPGPEHNGSSWSTAFLSVQAALNSATSGDEVWVASSSPAAPAYMERITLKAGVTLYGGFAGTETAKAQRDWNTNVTVLDGNGTTSSVVTASVQGGVMDGFTLRNGSTGIYVNGTTTIAHCSIYGNGCGVRIGSSGTANLSNCTVSGNSYGIYVPYVFDTSSWPALSFFVGTASVTNCTIVGNTYGIYGELGTIGPFDQVHGDPATLTNSIVAFNGTGIHWSDYGSSTLTLSHDDVYGNASGADATNGNISLDPKLSNAYHHIHLQPDSPCIDAGLDSAVTPGATDIDGQARVQGAHVDIGSDESDGTTWTVLSHTWYVAPTGDDGNDGLSWATAKRTVGAGLAAAQGMDEVWVAGGTYIENVTVAPGVTVYGGFTGTETARTQRDWRTNLTVLDGNSNNSSNVVTAPFLGIVLDGFTVRNGGYGVSVRGGMATISNCVISGDLHDGINVADGTATVSSCSVSGNGGNGIFASDYSTASVANCTVSANGCGIRLEYGTAAVSNCTITGNGGGVSVGSTVAYDGDYGHSGTATVTNSTISGNTSDGVYVSFTGEATVTNCAISANGGGVYVASGVGSRTTYYYGQGGTATVTNCTISGNSTYGVSDGDNESSENPAAINPGVANLTNCIVAFNATGIGRSSTSYVTLTLSHNDVYGSTTANYTGIADPTGSNGNLSADPLFVNRTGGDLHLLAASPCRNAGLDSVVAPGETDLDGNPRIIGPHVDIGAYEVGASVIRVNANAPGPAHDGGSWATAFLTVQAGLNAAAEGDEVWVARGTYVENITLEASVPLFGGFAGTEAIRGHRDWKTNVTILDGGGNSGANVVTSAVQGAVVDGFTVRSGCSGVSVSNGSATISRCTISSNTNAGIDVWTGTATVTNCILSGNRDAFIVCESGTAVISNCTMAGNFSGCDVLGGAATLWNCTVSGNSDGIDIQGGATTVTNCIVAFNGTGVIGGSDPLTLSHNDVFGNTAFNYTNIADPTGFNGNISQDPLLSNIYHDIHIQPNSPCIDAGDDSVVTPGETDVYGKPRVTGAHVDIGSDEYGGTVWPSIPPRVFRVSPTGNDASDGLSWATAKKTVRGALAVSQGTDEVWVAKGTYVENVTIPAGVALYGGFVGSETERGQRDWIANTTVLDGNGDSVVTLPFMAVVLDGFTIRNGSGGVYVNGGTATISNCTISGNSVGADVLTGTANVFNCAISGNGIGVYVYGGAAAVTNCTISGNVDAGVCVDSDNTTNVANCIVAFNGTGVFRPSGAAVTLSHNNVFGNTTADYSNITDPTGSNGNISADPLFINQVGSDYRLLPASPCRDAGDDSVVSPDETDLDGNPRISGVHADMGAYEYQVVRSRVVFFTQPGGARPGVAFANQPVVQVTDVAGIVDPCYTGPVTLSIKPGSGTAGATLVGTTTLNAVAGGATFTGLSIDRCGFSYVLTATSGGLTPGDSAPFNSPPAGATTTSRISVASDGTQGNGSSYGPSISADGRYVAFYSDASNLVAGDTNGKDDVFVRDTVAGTTSRISVASDGTQGNGSSYGPSISADGRYVAFHSSASNLAAGDTNGHNDVFVRDTLNSTTTLISVASDGTQGNADSFSPSISADGRYVAFYSFASNLVVGDTNGCADAFVRDTQTGITTRVSVAPDGTQGNHDSNFPTISADGRYVAFDSGATTFLSDSGQGWDVFVKEMQTGILTRASVSTGGAQGNSDSYYNCISADGRQVVFSSLATNLVPGDTNGAYDVFVRDISDGTTTRVSVTADGSQANGDSYYDSISADGMYIAFRSDATNLVPGDSNGVGDIFVRGTLLTTTTRVSVASDGTQGEWASPSGAISADGRYVAFRSSASVLVPGDTNGVQDIFVRGPLFNPDTLTFSTQPAGAMARLPLATQPVVTLLDPCGDMDTTFPGTVTMAIKAGTGTAGAVLRGTTTVNAVAGVAAFAGLSIDKPGTGFVLTASCGTLSPVDSQPFDVGVGAFVWADVVRTLRVAGGLDIADAWDIAHHNPESPAGRVDLRDAVRIARKAAGLEANP